VVSKQFHAQAKVRNTADGQSVPWRLGRSWKLCESGCLKHRVSVDSQSAVCRYPGDYIRLNDSPHGPGWGLILTYLLLSSTTNWLSSHEGISPRQTKHVRDTSRKLGRLSIYQAFSLTRQTGMGTPQGKRALRKAKLIEMACG
jgi:hypothetical protein